MPGSAVRVRGSPSTSRTTRIRGGPSLSTRSAVILLNEAIHRGDDADPPLRAIDATRLWQDRIWRFRAWHDRPEAERLTYLLACLSLGKTNQVISTWSGRTPAAIAGDLRRIRTALELHGSREELGAASRILDRAGENDSSPPRRSADPLGAATRAEGASR